MAFDFKEYYEGQVEFYQRQLEWVTTMLGYCARQTERELQKSKELVEYVWSKGPVTKRDMELFSKDFRTEEWKQADKERRCYYRQRRTYKERLANYTKLLEQLNEKAK
jgi:hypothetical protein